MSLETHAVDLVSNGRPARNSGGGGDQHQHRFGLMLFSTYCSCCSHYYSNGTARICSHYYSNSTARICSNYYSNGTARIDQFLIRMSLVMHDAFPVLEQIMCAGNILSECDPHQVFQFNVSIKHKDFGDDMFQLETTIHSTNTVNICWRSNITVDLLATGQRRRTSQPGKVVVVGLVPGC